MYYINIYIYIYFLFSGCVVGCGFEGISGNGKRAALMGMTSTIGGFGRFGNHAIRNLCLSEVARKNNLKVKYSCQKEFDQLGIELFSGEKSYQSFVTLDDDTFYDYISGVKILDCNIDINASYLQRPNYALFIWDLLHSVDVSDCIKKCNPYKNRYNNNNDVYVHLRLGDIPHLVPNYQYFSTTLTAISFNQGYISTEDLHHPFCQRLMKEFNLEPLTMEEISTIQFASTCKNIILSNGSFSWLIGLLGFFSEVYYPEIREVWHGDIFVFPQWKEVFRPDHEINPLHQSEVRPSKGVVSAD